MFSSSSSLTQKPTGPTGQPQVLQAGTVGKDAGGPNSSPSCPCGWSNPQGKNGWLGPEGPKPPEAAREGDLQCPGQLYKRQHWLTCL